MAISPFSTAIEFTFTSPNSVNLDETFTTLIESSETEIHDVKIFILDKDKKILSEIFSEDWKNPYYYLKSSYPNQTEYKIKSLEAGTHQICARLRQTGKSSFSEMCNEIEIKNVEDKIEKESFQNETKNILFEKEVPPIVNNTKSIQPRQITQSINYPTNEKLILKPNIQISSEFTSKKQNLRNAILYSFTAFTVLIIILLALRKL
jgi:hypothetical protein